MSSTSTTSTSSHNGDATPDPRFYDRADEFIERANAQCERGTRRGKVSASFLYAASRFNAYVSACGFDSADAMRAAKQETIEYFAREYRVMLEENLDDYIENFDRYMPRLDEA